MRLKRISAVAVMVVLLYAAHGFAQMEAPADDPSQPTRDEQQLLDLTNEARNEQGLGQLHWDPALAAAAQQHNLKMRGQPELEHQYPGEDALLQRAAQAGAHFASIAENIAMGPSPGAIQREWLHSAPHRANIFDPRMNAIGISVMRRGGDLYATEDFSQSVASVGPGQAEAKVAGMVRQQGLTVLTDGNAVRDARETCEMNKGSAGGTQPHFIVRWEGSSLDQLPDALNQQMASGKFKSAVVGSCTSMHPQQGFTTYRMAVLLY